MDTYNTHPSSSTLAGLAWLRMAMSTILWETFDNDRNYQSRTEDGLIQIDIDSLSNETKALWL